MSLGEQQQQHWYPRLRHLLARKDVLAGLLFSAVALLGLWLSRDYPIGSALRMASSGENSATVMLQDIEPGGDVGSVFLTRLNSDFQVCAKERRTPSSATSSSAA